MRADIFELISFAKERGLIAKIITNGVLLNKDMARKLLDSGLDKINLSMDICSDEGDEIRGVKGAYQRA